MDSKERAEAVVSILEMLQRVKTDPAVVKEIEKTIARVMGDLEEAINTEALPDPALYEQQALLTKLQSALESLRRVDGELDQLERELQDFMRGKGR